MKVLIALSAVLTVVACGLIHHDTEDHKATSYQNIHIEHFHSVPTYVKKEDAHLLEHPISKGKTSSKVEVHHGGKHDHGYAIADTQSDLHAQGHEDFAGHDFSGSSGHDFGGHEYAAIATAGGAEAGHGYSVAAGGDAGHAHGYALAAGGDDGHGQGYTLAAGGDEGHVHGYAAAAAAAAAAAGNEAHQAHGYAGASDEGHGFGQQVLSSGHEAGGQIDLSQYHGLEQSYSGGDIGGHAAVAGADAGASHGLGHYH